MDKQEAFAEINKILGSDIVKKEDEKTGSRVYYRPFTEFGEYPSWLVTQEGDTVRMDAVVMDGTKWDPSKKKDKKKNQFIHWQTIIFSTDGKKWEYNIPSSDGATGGGKKVSTNDKGIYEYYKTAFHNLAPGYRLLVEGTNPNIRLKGISKRKDIKVSPEMVAALKAGLRLNELFIFTRGQIGKAE